MKFKQANITYQQIFNKFQCSGGIKKKQTDFGSQSV